MAEEFPGISKESYLDSEGKAQDGLTYDMLARIHNNLGTMGVRVDTIENNCRSKRKINTVMTGTMAFFGGMMAFLIQTATFKKMG